VRIAGVKVGQVDELEFKGGIIESASESPRARARESERAREGEVDHPRRRDFYVTTQGVLGEQFMQIDPGNSGAADFWLKMRSSKHRPAAFGLFLGRPTSCSTRPSPASTTIANS